MKEIIGIIPTFGNLYVILPQNQVELCKLSLTIRIWKNKSSIRVVNGMVERILFREFDGGIRITVLGLDDTHYGNKK